MRQQPPVKIPLRLKGIRVCFRALRPAAQPASSIGALGRPVQGEGDNLPPGGGFF